MLGWFLRRQIAKFERTWNYDASYLHEMIDTDPQAMLAFGTPSPPGTELGALKSPTSSACGFTLTNAAS